MVVDSDPATGLPRPKELGPLEGVPEADGVLVAASVGSEYASVLNTVQACSSPASPIFVYPSAPLVYVLTERPNPTRLAHLYPGAASPTELGAVMHALDESDVSLAVVSDYWRGFWGPGAGQNQPLEDFLSDHFHEVARAGLVRVLARGSAC
jgi:hypothetical protein